jgi:L-rhamnose mutarotase
MKIFAFKMCLKPGCENEYAKRHTAIWPELKKQLVEHQGISNYSIFGDKETNVLFAYQECSKDTNS